MPGARRAKKMSMRDQLTLSPLAKWRLYGRPPVKLILQLLIVGVATGLILTEEAQSNAFYRETRFVWINYFYNTNSSTADRGETARTLPTCPYLLDPGFAKVPQAPKCYLRTQDQLRGWLNQTGATFFDLPTRFLAELEFADNRPQSLPLGWKGRATPYPPQLDVQWQAGQGRPCSKIDPCSSSSSALSAKSPYGALAQDAMNKEGRLIQDMRSFNLRLRAVNYNGRPGQYHRESVVWTLSWSGVNDGGGSIVLKLALTAQDCTMTRDWVLKVAVFIGLIGACALHAGLVLKAAWRAASQFRSTRDQYATIYARMDQGVGTQEEEGESAEQADERGFTTVVDAMTGQERLAVLYDLVSMEAAGVRAMEREDFNFERSRAACVAALKDELPFLVSTDLMDDGDIVRR